MLMRLRPATATATERQLDFCYLRGAQHVAPASNQGETAEEP